MLTLPMPTALKRMIVLSITVGIVVGATLTDEPVGAIDAADVAAGGEHSCLVTNLGGVKCWGLNGYGQLGDATTIDRHTPVDVTGLTSGVASVSTGLNHTCAVTTSGGIKCWGQGSRGKLGNGSSSSQSTPVDVTGLTSGASAVSAGADSTCALTTAGGAKCWGSNEQGQLGDGFSCDFVACTTPVDVTGLSSGVSAIGVGGTGACALTDQGAVKCWGGNSLGELGDGQTCGSNACATPVDVTGLTSGVSSIGTGGVHSCAVTVAGGLKCWGDNASGQLGFGTDVGPETCNFLSCSTTPVDVVGLSSGVSAVGGGGNHTCALKSSGGIKCWGYNSKGQVGDGTTSQCDSPVDVVGLTSGMSAISVGAQHSCALTPSGTAKCWGNNNRGRLGDGTTTSSAVPVFVIEGSSPPDTDGDGCTNAQEAGVQETLGGLRDPKNPWDFYDVAGGGGGPPDGYVDLFNDISGVIYHYAPTGTEPEYDVNFDRGPSGGPNPWNMTAPDGKIDLFNDISGVIAQAFHDCR